MLKRWHIDALQVEYGMASLRSVAVWAFSVDHIGWRVSRLNPLTILWCISEELWSSVKWPVLRWLYLNGAIDKGWGVAFHWALFRTFSLRPSTMSRRVTERRNRW